jgi:hypothetical protein
MTTFNFSANDIESLFGVNALGTKGGYVYGNDTESTTTMGGSKKTETKTTIVDPQVNDVVDGDLPF